MIKRNKYREVIPDEEIVNMAHPVKTWFERRLQAFIRRSDAGLVASGMMTCYDRVDIRAKVYEISFNSWYWTGRGEP